MKKVIKIKPLKGFVGIYIKLKEMLGLFSGQKGSIIGWASAWDTIYQRRSSKK